MRTAFLDELFQLAAEDDRVTLIVGDLGFSVVERFAKTYPDRFVNAGVSEQNMTGLAAGMAMTGNVVFTYSIANFPTLRCLEQIRNDVCYHRANVKVVSVGGGFAYGNLGMTHHAVEDLAIMRALPGMVVIAPGDPVEARLATRALVERDGPGYLRLGKAGEPIVHLREPAFHIGKAIALREGTDVALIATGGMLATTVAAADRLASAGVSALVLSMHTLSPLDVDAVKAAAESTPFVVTIEEHSIVGGLGGAVAEVIAELPGRHASLRRIGMRPEFSTMVGNQEYLRLCHGLDIDSICRCIAQLLERELGILG